MAETGVGTSLGLQTSPLDARLPQFLAIVRDEIGALWVAVDELDGGTGVMRPRRRVHTSGAPPAAPENDAFAPGAREGGRVWVVALGVAPALAASGDAVLVLAFEAPRTELPPLDHWRAELEAALSEDRRAWLGRLLLAAIDQGVDAIELTDRTARLVYVNAAWQKLTGYDRDEAVGRTVGALLRDPRAPLHDSLFYTFTMDVLHSGSPWTGVVTGCDKHGERTVREVSVSPFRSGDAIVGHLAVRRDLGQRAEREEALARAHHEFRAVLSALPDGVAVLRDDRIVFANPRLLEVLGRDFQQVSSCLVSDLVHPEDRADIARGASGARVVQPDGHLRYVEFTAAGELSFEGRPARVVVARDVTELRLTQERLAHADKLSALGELSAGIAHEINNPLTYVLTNLQLLLEGTDDPRDELLHEALEGTERVRKIVAELRTFTRGIEAPEAPTAVDVTRAATSAINIALNHLRHRARLDRALMPGLRAVGHEGPLVQVVVNLLVNAAQAIDPEPSGPPCVVRVASAEDGDSVLVTVSDTGRGMTPEVLARVFDPFFTTKPRGEGSGLGLSICRRIVESYGGTMSIESRVGEGTTVTVRLARAPD